jgi:epoxyqueuosine reductase
VTLVEELAAYARGLGFDLIGTTPIESPAHLGAFQDWLASGHHGEMAYMARQADLRADPAALSPGARTIISVGASYAPNGQPEEVGPSHGRFARYAWTADYHGTMKTALYRLDGFLRAHSGRTSPGKICVDSAPLIERDFAARAGLGFIGRNTCLIRPELGSWIFLGALLVPESVKNAPPAARFVSPHRVFADCGRCTRCLNACPTGAFVTSHVLDARRCISYLTIELRGPIPRELRSRMGNWVFGCDICQEACPYNRAAPPATWSALATDWSREAIPLQELLGLGEQDFRSRFRGTSVLRAKRRGLVRNACVAAGNSRDTAALPILEGLLADPEPLVRGHAAWAVGRIGGAGARRTLCHAAAVETDPWARGEISAALDD